MLNCPNATAANRVVARGSAKKKNKKTAMWTREEQQTQRNKTN
jgi:hypothetical protein